MTYYAEDQDNSFELVSSPRSSKGEFKFAHTVAADNCFDFSDEDFSDCE